MPAQRQLTALQQRKRLLVMEGNLHRALLRAECLIARERLNWIDKARDQARSSSPWLAVSASAIGLLAASRWRTLTKWIPITLSAWRSVQKWKTG